MQIPHCLTVMTPTRPSAVQKRLERGSESKRGERGEEVKVTLLVYPDIFYSF